MIGHLQSMVFVASSFFLVAYLIWLALARRYAPRWIWLQAFNPEWRNGITSHNALIYGAGAVIAWLIANSALVLLAGVPRGAQALALTVWIAITTISLVAWFVARTKV